MSHKLMKFVDRLPIMDTLKPKKKLKDGNYYEVRMEQFCKSCTETCRRHVYGATIVKYQGQHLTLIGGTCSCEMDKQSS